MKAKKKELITITVEELLKVDPRQQTEKMYFPEKKGGGIVLEGDPGDLADKVIQILKEKTSALA